MVFPGVMDEERNLTAYAIDQVTRYPCYAIQSVANGPDGTIKG